VSDQTFNVPMTQEQINIAVRLLDAAVRAQGINAAADALQIAQLLQQAAAAQDNAAA
jgi:hypothetical protein